MLTYIRMYSSHTELCMALQVQQNIPSLYIAVDFSLEVKVLQTFQGVLCHHSNFLFTQLDIEVGRVDGGMRRRFERDTYRPIDDPHDVRHRAGTAVLHYNLWEAPLHHTHQVVPSSRYIVHITP